MEANGGRQPTYAGLYRRSGGGAGSGALVHAPSDDGFLSMRKPSSDASNSTTSTWGKQTWANSHSTIGSSSLRLIKAANLEQETEEGPKGEDNTESDDLRQGPNPAPVRSLSSNARQCNSYAALLATASTNGLIRSQSGNSSPRVGSASGNWRTAVTTSQSFSATSTRGAPSRSSTNGRATLAALMDDGDEQPVAKATSAGPKGAGSSSVQRSSGPASLSNSNRTLSEAWAVVQGSTQAAGAGAGAAAAAGNAAAAATAAAASKQEQKVPAGKAAAPTTPAPPTPAGDEHGAAAAATANASGSHPAADVAKPAAEGSDHVTSTGEADEVAGGEQAAMQSDQQGAGAPGPEQQAEEVGAAAAGADGEEGRPEQHKNAQGTDGSATMENEQQQEGEYGDQKQTGQQQDQDQAQQDTEQANNSEQHPEHSPSQSQPAAGRSEDPSAASADVATPEMTYLSPEASDPDLEGRASQSSRLSTDHAAAAAATAAVIAAAAAQHLNKSSSSNNIAAAAAGTGDAAADGEQGAGAARYGELVNRLQMYLPALKVAASSASDFESTWQVLEAELSALVAAANMAASQTKQLTSLDAEVVQLQQLLTSVTTAMRTSTRRSTVIRTGGPSKAPSSASLNLSLTAADAAVVAASPRTRLQSRLSSDCGDAVVTPNSPSALQFGSGPSGSSSSKDQRPPWTFYNRAPTSSRIPTGMDYPTAGPTSSASGSSSIAPGSKRASLAGAGVAIQAPIRTVSLAELPPASLGAGRSLHGRNSGSTDAGSDAGDAGSDGESSGLFRHSSLNFLPPVDLTQWYKVPVTSAEKVGYKVRPNSSNNAAFNSPRRGAVTTAGAAPAAPPPAAASAATPEEAAPANPVPSAAAGAAPGSPARKRPAGAQQSKAQSAAAAAPAARPGAKSPSKPSSPARWANPGSPLRAAKAPAAAAAPYRPNATAAFGRTMSPPSRQGSPNRRASPSPQQVHDHEEVAAAPAAAAGGHEFARTKAYRSAAELKAAAGARAAAAVAVAQGRGAALRAYSPEPPAAGQGRYAPAQAARVGPYSQAAARGNRVQASNTWGQDPAFKAALQAFKKDTRQVGHAQMVAALAGRPRSEPKQLQDIVHMLNKELAVHGIPWSITQLGPFTFAACNRKLQLVIRNGQVLVRSTTGYEEWTAALSRLVKDSPPEPEPSAAAAAPGRGGSPAAVGAHPSAAAAPGSRAGDPHAALAAAMPATRFRAPGFTEGDAAANVESFNLGMDTGTLVDDDDTTSTLNLKEQQGPTPCDAGATGDAGDTSDTGDADGAEEEPQGAADPSELEVAPPQQEVAVKDTSSSWEAPQSQQAAAAAAVAAVPSTSKRQPSPLGRLERALSSVAAASSSLAAARATAAESAAATEVAPGSRGAFGSRVAAVAQEERLLGSGGSADIGALL